MCAGCLSGVLLSTSSPAAESTGLCINAEGFVCVAERAGAGPLVQVKDSQDMSDVMDGTLFIPPRRDC